MRARFKATSLFAISAFLVLWVVPAIDLPETNFDKANTPTNDMVVQEPACLGCTSSLKAFVPRLFAHTRKTRVSNNTRSVRPAELSYSPYSQELLCTLRC